MVQLVPPRVQYPPDGSVQPVGRFIWFPVRVPPATGPKQAVSGKRVAIMGGNESTADRVTEALAAGGARIVRYSPGGSDPVEAAMALVAGTGGLDAIVDLTLDRPFNFAGGDAWQAPLFETFALLKAVYEDWATETDARRLFYLAVTYMDGLMGYGGTEIVQPLGGLWAGLAKTLPMEMPNLNVRILDLAAEDVPHIGAIVARELYDFGLFEIGYRQGVRYSLQGVRAEPGPPVIPLAETDTVLMTGGARGIGFALARSLARDCGCRVVVTGRAPAPDGTEEWLALDAASFGEWERNLYRQRPDGWTLADTRRYLEGLKARRELYRNLQEATSEGLRIAYRVCDVTSSTDVQELVSGLGMDLRGVIHNAGVDVPTRIYAKTNETIVATVSTKVTGLLNLLAAVRGRDLRFFCTVGSLTGRAGGTAGQTDYAAANECLARVGLWAAGQLVLNVKTLAWPTWNRLGLITNLEAAVRHMSAMDVDEGVYHWKRELLSEGSGEIGFMGRVGTMLTPNQLRGYLPIAGMPGLEDLLPLGFYLGEVLEFRAFRSMRSISVLDARYAPCLTDWLVSGVPSVPVSVILDLAVAAGRMIVPERGPALSLHEVRDIQVDLRALRRQRDCFTVEKEANGHMDGSRWLVDVQVTRADAGAGEPFARLQLVFAPNEPPVETVPLPPGDGTAADMPPLPGFSWRGLVYPPAHWTRATDGMLIGSVRETHGSDLWTAELPPEPLLPAAQLEAVLRAGMSLCGASAPPEHLFIAQLGIFGDSAACTVLLGRPPAQEWMAVDHEGRVGLRVTGLRCGSMDRRAAQSLV